MKRSALNHRRDQGSQTSTGNYTVYRAFLEDKGHVHVYIGIPSYVFTLHTITYTGTSTYTAGVFFYAHKEIPSFSCYEYYSINIKTQTNSLYVSGWTPEPLRSKMEVMTHMVNYLFKKYTFLLALSL